MKKTSPPKTAPQGIWSGTISFSLVAIPVRLVRALAPGLIAFRLLHDKDYSPLERKMFCPEDEAIVPPEEITKGYEIAPGRHIMISDEELESVSPERSRTIEISEFIDLNEVAPIYYERPYYLVPLKGGEKAYRLLALALQKTNKAGIAKFVLDERGYLALIKNRDGALELNTLHYSDEIIPGKDRKKAGFTEKEKDRLKKIIKEMTADFAPEKYSDRRRQAFLDLIKKKIGKKAAVEAPEIEDEEAEEGMADLMAALQESMRKMRKADEQKKHKHQ
ncbi:MAG: Ku protein [Candidatus Margulisiibacteriota bacterium]|jgi:DNA end-binding protein Ku